MYKHLYIVLLIAFPIFAHAQYCVWGANVLSATCGSSYKFDQNIYSNFDLNYAHYKSTGIYRGIGIQYENLKNNNFSAGVSYYNNFFNLNNRKFMPFVGIMPQYFQVNNIVGLNVQPQIGITLTPRIYKILYLNFVATYGYSIPLSGASFYDVGRQSLSIKAAIMFDIAYFLHKQRMRDNKEDPGKTLR